MQDKNINVSVKSIAIICDQADHDLIEFSQACDAEMLEYLEEREKPVAQTVKKKISDILIFACKTFLKPSY